MKKLFLGLALAALTLPVTAQAKEWMKIPIGAIGVSESTLTAIRTA